MTSDNDDDSDLNDDGTDEPKKKRAKSSGTPPGGSGGPKSMRTWGWAMAEKKEMAAAGDPLVIDSTPKSAYKLTGGLPKTGHIFGSHRNVMPSTTHKESGGKPQAAAAKNKNSNKSTPAGKPPTKPSGLGS